jgi:hypothetical protein
MKEVEEKEEQIRRVINKLKGGCIYCKLVYGNIRSSKQVELYKYIDYIKAEREGYKIAKYKE